MVSCQARSDKTWKYTVCCCMRPSLAVSFPQPLLPRLCQSHEITNRSHVQKTPYLPFAEGNKITTWKRLLPPQTNAEKSVVPCGLIKFDGKWQVFVIINKLRKWHVHRMKAKLGNSQENKTLDRKRPRQHSGRRPETVAFL